MLIFSQDHVVFIGPQVGQAMEFMSIRSRVQLSSSPKLLFVFLRLCEDRMCLK